MRVGRHERGQRPGPAGIGFEEQDDIGIGLLDQRQRRPEIAIVLQHIDVEQ